MSDLVHDAVDQAVGADPVAVVKAFLAALERLDLDAAMDLADESVVYQNVPFPAAKGKAATRRTLTMMLRFGTGFQVVMHNIAGDGGIVLTERTDILEAGRVRAAFWVCGTFEVRDGKVVLWRDYFDLVDVTRAFLWGLLRAPFRKR